MAEVERELGITLYILSKWVRQVRQEEEQAFPGKRKLTDRDEQLGQLQRKIEVLRKERGWFPV